jgi:hypothetical protein
VTVRLVVLFGLAWLYYLAAAEHARVVNVDRLRGDQSGYLWDAVAISMMWHGSPPVLVGERNRMPLYAGLLALTYDPSLSPDEFFEVGKKWNIRLSLLLLALLYVIFSRHLPPIVSTNLILIIAFGYSVFKAGYAQPELLFYFLVFVTFLSFCHLLTRPGPAASLWYGALGGLLAALAHLAKAAMLPLVVIFVAVYVVRDVAVLVRGAWQSDPGSRRDALSRFAWRAAAGALLVACFLGTLYPYISNSKRVFGSYFYNVNTTFYAWYDDWPQASVGTYRHGDGQGWPKMPAEQIPSMPRYWRGHTVKQIVDRVADGLTDMAKVSYTRFWYLKYVAIYVILAAVLIATNRRPFRQLIRSHAAVFWFMLLYAAVYLPAIAFYRPISGTTARMLLAHLAPLMFVLSYLFSRPPFRETRWTVAAVAVTPTHFHLLVLVSIALDLISGSFWVRLMTTYSGY